jgi:beta-glucosidase
MAGGGACIGNIAPITRLNFSGICYSDGPAAVNRHDLVSVFPSGITLAATWDMDLIYKKSAALGQEFRDKGTHVGLG